MKRRILLYCIYLIGLQISLTVVFSFRYPEAQAVEILFKSFFYVLIIVTILTLLELFRYLKERKGTQH